VANILVSLLPIFLFLIALVYLDSYKLVKFRSILLTIGIGCIIALFALYINTFIIEKFNIDIDFYPRYIAPVIEEILKTLFVIYLIKSKKVGFMVDAAIYGFAIGTGFAFTENIHYLWTYQEENFLYWLVRGCGTAMMHGGATAVVSVTARYLFDRYPISRVKIFLPGLFIAIIVHSFYNHFILHPVIFTILIMLTLPVMMMIIFKHSEDSTRIWLGQGLDSDVELIDLIMSGNLSESRIGQYLGTLITKFPADVIGDMLCFIRIHTELSMRAKGTLLMREAGFEPIIDKETKDKIRELEYLDKRIGKTGKMAISPILHKSNRSEWQLYLIKK
jgi:RsiW-degrading membrane proteinase PrsW (M82 family)